MATFPRPVTIMMFWMPECIASSTPYWMSGLSTSGSISLGCAFVAGRNRVPNPAAGNTAFLTLGIIVSIVGKTLGLCFDFHICLVFSTERIHANQKLYRVADNSRGPLCPIHPAPLVPANPRNEHPGE